MCGIVGQLRPAGQTVDPELLARMCAGLEHRGPDSRGHPPRRARRASGIQRLRVIDLEHGRPADLQRGPLGRRRPQRRDLQLPRAARRAGRRGHRFATKGDTEVIVHLYEEHGTDCVRHLHGMFAFALWDARRQQLLLARDRVGKKPLLYALRDGGLSFASELQALLAGHRHPARGRPRGARRLPRPRLRAGAADGVARRAQAAAGAHARHARRPASTLERYWALDYAAQARRRPVEELCERIRDGLLAATRRRLIADVPLGAFLSGGIDSSAVVAAMAAALGRAGADVLDRLRPRGLRRAPARAPDRRAVRDRARGVPGPRGGGRGPAADRAPLRRAVRRLVGDPVLLPRRADAPPRDRRAQRRRRRRVLRRLHSATWPTRLAGRLDRMPAPLRRALAARRRPRLPDGGDVVQHAQPRRAASRGALALDAPARYARYVS